MIGASGLPTRHGNPADDAVVMIFTGLGQLAFRPRAGPRLLDIRLKTGSSDAGAIDFHVIAHYRAPEILAADASGHTPAQQQDRPGDVRLPD